MKKVTGYTIDKELIQWVEVQSKKEDRSRSYIVNRSIKNERGKICKNES